MSNMSLSIYCRLFGQVSALLVHSINSIDMLIATQDTELLKDSKIKNMVSMQSRYLTVWNVGFQLMYFSIAFLCDISTVIGKDNVIPQGIHNFRKIFFASILWPTTMVVFTLFWPFFLTDRELLFPIFIDKIFSFENNLVIHGWIFIVALWELLFWPRNVPKMHSKNVIVTSSLTVLYLIVLLHTYNQRGIWPYPIMRLIYGTVYFPLLALTTYIIFIAWYFIQWKITPKLDKASATKKVK